jgi:beta-lactamase class A
MISISDNTAADHLLFFVGRTNVEAMLATTKHHDPTQNQPFLSTRELFDLKLLATPQDRTTYENDSIADRRTVLQTYDDTLDPRTATNASSWTLPIEIDKLEWFATPMDLCNVMAALKAYGDKPGTTEVSHALSINPGLPDDAKLFSYVGYKGGSEPGVLTMSWLLQRKSDKAWRFYTVELNDTAKAIDEDAATYLAGAGRAQMAK